MKSTHGHLGLNSLEEQGVIDALTVRGTIPNWLNGALLRVGPAKFEVGDTEYAHWFDGLAMLYRFSFADGRVRFANRFLESYAYREAMTRGRIAIGEFGTMPYDSKIRRILSRLLSPITDNANVNVSRMGGRIVALSETTHAMTFDPETLKCTGKLEFEDKLKAQVWTAHPHYDFNERKQYNLMIAYGPKNYYRFFSMAEGSKTRVVVSELQSSRPSYIHSFAATERYLILTEAPLVVPSITLAIGWKPFIENYRWAPENGFRFTVIRKSDGKVVATRVANPFFSFHHANAFEEGDDIVLDLVKFDDASVIQNLYLEKMRQTQHSLGALERFRLSLSSSSAPVTSTRIVPQRLEFPRINYARSNGRPYTYLYAVGDDEDGTSFARITKVDVTRGTVTSWREAGCHPGEPVFVAAPGASAEDEGVLLSIVFDASTERSFLLVLDAATLTEKARALLPHHVPLGFHGEYFESF